MSEERIAPRPWSALGLLGIWLLAAGCAVSPPAPAGQGGEGLGVGVGDGFLVGDDTGSGGCAASGDVADAGPTEPDSLCAPAVPAVSFARDVAHLVGCTGKSCHSAWTYDSLVGQRSDVCCDARDLVVPGHPSRSHLVQTLLGTSPCIGRMPRGRTPLSDAQIATVVSWVCEGAPRN